MRNKSVTVFSLLFVAVILAVTGYSQPPDNWKVSPNKYMYTMTITTQLKMNGKISRDTNDVIAAFVGNECRGLAHASDSISPTYTNLAFLMVYSNNQSTQQPDTIQFKLYDADEDTVLILPNRILFTPNGDYGMPSRPLLNVKGKDIIAYNFFTPNNDDKNDYWRIRNKNIYIDFELFIYDSNGQQVLYKKRDYRNTWDGTHNGKKLPEGVYYYLLKAPDGSAAYKGTISLVR